MILNSEAKFKYTVDGKINEVYVVVKLKQHKGLINFPHNIWYAEATVNDNKYDDPNLKWCVNAQYEAEDILEKVYQEYKKKYRSEGKIFRRKK